MLKSNNKVKSLKKDGRRKDMWDTLGLTVSSVKGDETFIKSHNGCYT